MNDQVADFILKLAKDFGPAEEPIQRWEFWSNGRKRSTTICVTLRSAEVPVAHRGVSYGTKVRPDFTVLEWRNKESQQQLAGADLREDAPFDDAIPFE